MKFSKYDFIKFSTIFLLVIIFLSLGFHVFSTKTLSSALVALLLLRFVQIIFRATRLGKQTYKKIQDKKMFNEVVDAIKEKEDPFSVQTPKRDPNEWK